MTLNTATLRAATLALGAIFCSPAFAQVTATAAAPSNAVETEKLDIYGAAAYSHFNPGYARHVEGINILGWEGSVTRWFGNSFGLEATARGLYGSYNLPAQAQAVYGLPTTSGMQEHLFLFGPSFRMYQSQRYTAGMHFLIGGTYGVFDKSFSNSGIQPFQFGVYNNQLASAYAFGGWGDYKLSPKWAVRFTADYQPTRYTSIGQNEFFGAVGIVYKWGHRK